MIFDELMWLPAFSQPPPSLHPLPPPPISYPAPHIPTLGLAQGLSPVICEVENSDTNNSQKDKKKNPTCEEIHFNFFFKKLSKSGYLGVPIFF